MSTCWGLRCKTCNEITDWFANHGEADIRQYVQLRKLIDDSGIDTDKLNIEIEGYRWMTGELDEFWRKHAGHELVLENEYDEREAL